MEQLAVEHVRDHQLIQSVAIEAVECVGRLIDLSSGLTIIAVVGCGPNPYAVQQLLEAGYNAVGVEPVPGFLEAARGYLGGVQRTGSSAWYTRTRIPSASTTSVGTGSRRLTEERSSRKTSASIVHAAPAIALLACRAIEDAEKILMRGSRRESLLPDCHHRVIQIVNIRALSFSTLALNASTRSRGTGPRLVAGSRCSLSSSGDRRAVLDVGAREAAGDTRYCSVSGWSGHTCVMSRM